MNTTAMDSVKVGRAHVLMWSAFDKWVAIEGAGPEADQPEGWQTVRIAELVEQVHARIIVEPEGSYDLAGVRLDGGGVYHRESVRGEETSAKHLSKLHPGAFIYGRLFAWRGAFSAVRSDHAELWCSNEFPQFSLDEDRLDVDYLVRFMLHPQTLARVSKSSVGTAAISRNRFKEHEFLQLRIPLPPLETQRSIVAHWQAGMARAAALEAQAQDRVEEAQREFVEALGIGGGAGQQVPRAFALTNDRLERWSISFIKQALQGDALARSQHPVLQLRDVVADLENGWSPQCHNRPAKEGEWGVLKLGAVSFGAYDESENKALPSALKPIPAYEIKSGDVLISRANVPRYVGACAQVLDTRPKLLLCDKIFRVVFHTISPLDGAYLAEVMKTPPLRQQIEAAITGSSPTMQNITKTALLALRLPVPPVKEQRALVKVLTHARAEAVGLRDEAEVLRRKVKEEVEGMVMGRT